MINQKTGVITISHELHLSPEYNFNEFKESRYYGNHDPNRIITLGAIQEDSGQIVYVSLIFKNFLLKKVMLLLDHPDIKSYCDEPKRKDIHDIYLDSMGLKTTNEFQWGSVVSDYDSNSNSNISHIIVSFKW